MNCWDTMVVLPLTKGSTASIRFGVARFWIPYWSLSQRGCSSGLIRERIITRNSGGNTCRIKYEAIELSQSSLRFGRSNWANLTLKPAPIQPSPALPLWPSPRPSAHKLMGLVLCVQGPLEATHLMFRKEIQGDARRSWHLIGLLFFACEIGPQGLFNVSSSWVTVDPRGSLSVQSLFMANQHSSWT